jgi:hypothetical protein
MVLLCKKAKDIALVRQENCLSLNLPIRIIGPYASSGDSGSNLASRDLLGSNSTKGSTSRGKTAMVIGISIS